jgi:alpha-beta hydrolase superfamily lysophospholipase
VHVKVAPDAGLVWSDDELLAGFVAARLPAAPVLAGSPAASVAAGRSDPVLTLVRRADTPAEPRGVVVHLHGYNDYFFQSHLVATVEAAGFAFLAVDARRAGRSWRLGEVPHYQDDLREQGTDLTAAVSAARRLHPGLPLVVHAHSAGGLVAALWAHAHRERDGIEGLVLDSPFLTAAPGFMPVVGDEAVRALARFRPLTPLSSRPSSYATHLLAANGGRWDFDTRLKRPEGLPARAGWLAATRAGQARVARGLEIACPVLVAHSSSSGPDRPDNPDLDAQDTILDVRAVARLAPSLGGDVTVRAIEGGVHDLSLSADEPRAAYLGALADFLARVAR